MEWLEPAVAFLAVFGLLTPTGAGTHASAKTVGTACKRAHVPESFHAEVRQFTGRVLPFRFLAPCMSLTPIDLSPPHHQQVTALVLQPIEPSLQALVRRRFWSALGDLIKMVPAADPAAPTSRSSAPPGLTPTGTSWMQLVSEAVHAAEATGLLHAAFPEDANRRELTDLRTELWTTVTELSHERVRIGEASVAGPRLTRG